MLTFELDNVEIDSPIGWDDITMSFSRDEFYHGIDFLINSEFEFIGTGYDILNGYIEARDFDREVLLKIFADDQMIYKGKINLFDYTKVNKKITVPIQQINFFQQIISRETLEIDLYKDVGIDGQALSPTAWIGRDFIFEGIFIDQRADLELKEENEWRWEVITTGSFEIGYSPKLNVLGSEFNSVKQQGSSFTSSGGAMQGYLLSNQPPGIQKFVDETNYLIDMTLENPRLPGIYNFNLLLNGDVRAYEIDTTTGNITSSNYSNLVIEIILYYGQIGQTINQVVLISLPIQNNGAWQSYTNILYQNGINLNGDDYAHLSFRVAGLKTTGNTGLTTNFVIETRNTDWSISIQSDTLFPATTQKVSAIHEVFSRVLESISGKNNVLKSDYYGRVNSTPRSYTDNGCGAFRVITNGYQIRGFNELTDENSELYKPPILSLQSLFESMNAIDNIGMSVEENQVIIEQKDHFYNDELIADLGEIHDVEFTVINELYPNEVNIGYEQYDDTIRGGLNEFASQRQYSNKIKNNGQTYNQLSKLIASPYAIERTRRDDRKFKPRESSAYDKDNFIIETIRVVNDLGPILTSPATRNSIDGIASNVIEVNNMDNGNWFYNIPLSPVRNLLRHLNVLPGNWDFVSGEGNTLMQSRISLNFCPDFDEQLLSEKQNNLKAEKLLYFPIKVSFEYPVKMMEFIEWKNKKYGYFEFMYCDKIHQAYIWNIEWGNNMAQFELILRK